MADKIAKVRTRFVEKVTMPVISQLLDDILEDRIVNDEEREYILQENGSRAEKARSLIDAVKRKGDGACNKMIAHLQRRDPTLFSEVGLSCAEPPKAAEPQMKQEWSTTLIPATEVFWREKQQDQSIYPVTKNNIENRVALLITNIKFTNEKLNRNGADKDEKNTEKLLKDLGYEVVKHTNITGKAIDEAVIKFSKHPKLRATDSVVVVIMSHGKLGAVLGVNWKDELSADEKPDEFRIDNIFKHLGSQKCPELLNKPKIIIIQACRGEKKGSVLVSDGAKPALSCDDVLQTGPPARAGEEDFEDDTVRCVHSEKDFICLLSSTPDNVSYRDPNRGSLLIQYIADVLNTVAHKDDIEELFRKVMQRFEDFCAGSKRQMPTKDRCTLTKRFYFFPGVSAV